VRIGLALERRPDHADENLLTVGTGPAPIAATDLARDDRGPDRVFGAQFVASIVGSNRNDQMAVNSRSRCLAKRSTSGTRLDRRHQRDHVGTELGRSGANGIRRLQRMTPLHTPLASRAPADVQINLPDHDTHRRQFFLVLRGDGRFDDRTGAGWTLQRQRGCRIARRPATESDDGLSGRTRVPPSGLDASDAGSTAWQKGPLAGTRLAALLPLVVSDDRSGGEAVLARAAAGPAPVAAPRARVPRLRHACASRRPRSVRDPNRLASTTPARRSYARIRRPVQDPLINYGVGCGRAIASNRKSRFRDNRRYRDVGDRPQGKRQILWCSP
jgi:hypothetical protein